MKLLTIYFDEKYGKEIDKIKNELFDEFDYIVGNEEMIDILNYLIELKEDYLDKNLRNDENLDDLIRCIINVLNDWDRKKAKHRMYYQDDKYYDYSWDKDWEKYARGEKDGK